LFLVFDPDTRICVRTGFFQSFLLMVSGVATDLIPHRTRANRRPYDGPVSACQEMQSDPEFRILGAFDRHVLLMTLGRRAR
jgi:hypothetical protein